MIYLDYNASSPMLPEVERIVAGSWRHFSNPSGTHRAALAAADLVEESRTELATILGAKASDLIFTSGSTESLTIAIWGQILGASASRNKVFTSSIEHKAVLATARVACEVAGKELILIPVDQDGVVEFGFLESHLDASAALVAVMAANNETGAIQPYSQISALAERFQIPYLCDSTQAFGKHENFNARELNAMLTVSGHKMYGPKGVGALIMSRELQRTCIPVFQGGGQERGIRGGTTNLPGVMGLVAAVRTVMSGLETEMRQEERLTALFWEGLTRAIGESLILNSTFNGRLKNTLNIRFVGVPADVILVSLREVVASKASACQAGVEEPSHVLLAMGRSREAAEESIRFSLGIGISESDIYRAIDDVSQAVGRVRSLTAGDWRAG